MIAIDCNTADIPVQLDSCAGSVLTAKLYRPHGVKVELIATLDPSTPGIVKLAGIPDDLPKGVYTLTVQTACGCFSTPVAVRCSPVALPGTHYPTNAPGIIKACCPEDVDPDISVSHVTAEQEVLPG